MSQIASEKIYTCLINRSVNTNCNTVITVILFNWFSMLTGIFYTDMFFCFVSKIDMYADLFTLNTCQAFVNKSVFFSHISGRKHQNKLFIYIS